MLVIPLQHYDSVTGDAIALHATPASLTKVGTIEQAAGRGGRVGWNDRTIVANRLA